MFGMRPVNGYYKLSHRRSYRIVRNRQCFPVVPRFMRDMIKEFEDLDSMKN